VAATSQSGPELSVVMVTPGSFEMLRQSIGHLREQTARERLELVLVGPTRDGFETIEAELAGFWGHQVVEAGDFRTTGLALTLGFQASTGPVIGYVEEHSFPQPGWAEALIEAHRGPWAAVGVGMMNANPQRALSWASLLIAFEGSVEPQVSGEVEKLPSHHIHYKRTALAPYGDRLEDLLEMEAVLCDDLRRRGGRLYISSAARERHINVSAPRSFVTATYCGGRTFGAARVQDEGFSPLMRLLYSAAGPLIVAVKLRRLLGDIRRIKRTRELIPRILPAALLGLTVFQLGELHGYVTGSAGAAAEDRMLQELDRSSHVATTGEGR
jgi:hypothetical protein